jgi:hypothetical protein
MRKTNHPTLASKLADKYFQAQCERLGPIGRDLYNAMYDVVIDDMLAQAGIGKRAAHQKAAGATAPASLDDLYAGLKGER